MINSRVTTKQKYKFYPPDHTSTIPRLTLNFDYGSSSPIIQRHSAAIAHTKVFDNVWRKLELVQQENQLLSLFGINKPPTPAAPTPVPVGTPHLNYITSISLLYKPIAYGDRDLLIKYLRTKILVNNSSRRLSDRDVEALALGLNFVLHSDFAPGCPIEELSETNTRWIVGINRSINFTRNRERKILEKGLNAPQQLRGILESSGRLERDADDWDPFDNLDNEWTKQPQFYQLNERIKQATLGDKFPQPQQNKRKPLYESIRALGDDQSIHILSADKGGATVVLDTIDYDREAHRQLEDKKTYTELDQLQYQNGLKETTETLKKLADTFLRGGHITKTEHSVFHAKSKNLEGSYIYFLPKIHKTFNEVINAFPGRPIAATFMCVVHTLDKFITELTKPLLAIIPGSLIDTTDLLNKLPKGKLTRRTKFVTSDVNSLYPAIPWEDGINAATTFYARHIIFLRKHNRENGLLPPPSVIDFHDAITAVITRSFITFKGRRFFKQSSGTSMGSCISVYLANTFMYQLTRRHIPHGINQPALDRPEWLLFFERYIDDLILIVDECTEDDINQFFNGISNDTISYTTTEASFITPALDVSLSIRQETLRIVTEPYCKPTSKPTFLHAASMHPVHSIESLPYAQLLRLKRISSNDEIYQRHASALTESFLLRGYSTKTIQKALAKANAVARSDLLTRKSEREENPTSSVANSFKYITKYSDNGNWTLVKTTLKEMHANALQFYQLRADTEVGYYRDEAVIAVKILMERDFTLVFSIHNSTKDALTRNYKRPNEKKASD